MSRVATVFNGSQKRQIAAALKKNGLTGGIKILREKGLNVNQTHAVAVAEEHGITFPKGRPVKGAPKAFVAKKLPAATPPLSKKEEAIRKAEIKKNLQDVALDSIDNILQNQPLREWFAEAFLSDDPNQPAVAA